MTICSTASYAYNAITGIFKTELTWGNDRFEHELLLTAAAMKIAIVALAIFCSAIFFTSFYLEGGSVILIPLSFVGILTHDLWRLSNNMKTIVALGTEIFKKYPESEKKDVILKNMWLKHLFFALSQNS